MVSVYNKSEWIGKKYGKLTVIKPVRIKTCRSTQWYWEMRCDCGGIAVVKPIEVIKGKIVSCGCYRKNRRGVGLTHGMSHTKLHNIWCGMNNRCNPEHKNSEGYGGRGIRVCEEWSKFEAFRDWAISNGYQDGLTIERKDVNGDYTPHNCTWIPLEKQARNRRTTRWVTYQGREMSLAEASEISGIPYKVVHNRIKQGWSLEEALSRPLREHALSLRRKCEERGLNYHSVYNRISRGWSEEDAFSTPFVQGNNQFTKRGYDGSY